MSPGADQAFYAGAAAAGGRVELYLPWPGFQAQVRAAGGRRRVLAMPRPSPAAYRLAARFHPRWALLTSTQRALLARDAHEVLGADLASPVRLVVCWTAGGSLDGQGVYADGTGQTLRIAHAFRIPVLNLARPGHAARAGVR
jgi:hypothetical protein